ncbi:double-strand break repair helicase AddA [Rhizobiaceae bacterium BDR2-2]|uniref:DNA 3'-5' helicase n=1 Tax=Ectorhizobium quercum TaxID=2965071 RepID=A0AAE3SX74_9HYPH|nr:double-strand break repair helicase AddA [Ectorhizobium quercum]MCX8999473.1 double-strand break repair helicase AddA [Ectorhizobium quercum]
MANEPDIAPDPQEWLSRTAERQSMASDPARSAWVSANAGSGKTHVLTQRVIRLLLAGCRPSAILCLTYTKAAASEMSNRVFARLAEWAVLDETELSRRIEAIEGLAPDAIKLAEARRLFARALETPGGLKIQTIHAFCEALLHQFPLEANVAGHFSVLDDRAAAALLADARRSLLTATTTEDDGDLAEAFAHVLSLADETGLETLLADIVANRQALSRFLAGAAAQGGIEAVLRDGYGIGPLETVESVTEQLWPLPGLSGPMLTAYLDQADANGSATVKAIAAEMRTAVAETDPARRLAVLEGVLLTKEGKPKSLKTLVSAAMRKADPRLDDLVAEAAAHLLSIRDRLRLFAMLEATKAALTLAARLLADYEELKKRRSQLDFEDLIARTATLLTRKDIGPWVHYKLDQGIDHILVDEAQDTSPVQWTVITSLTEDFFSGESARGNALRTVFAVGDEKQSIYSFQGARPERFSAEREATERRVRAGGLAFSPISLPLSFRSTADVLSAVDAVFSSEANARGLSARAEPVVHVSNRIGHPGAVDLWDMIRAEKRNDEEDWIAPYDSTPESQPPAVLARRIALTIREMIGHETIVEKDRARFIEPGDILVLVRKRDSFVNALTRALKNLDNIPVAGADRLTLTGHIAVQDLMALGRFLVSERDDLSLAATLKSPLFDLSEEDLLELAAYRDEGQSLWARLKALADAGTERYAAAVETLNRLAALARSLSVHDFYARLLGADGGRRRFLARLGSEVSDILDEFLTFALDHETTGLPGLSAFLATMETEAPVVKREQDKGRNEVRIMTVHASKGLEAPVVFLVDGGSKAFSHSHLPKFRLIERAEDEAALPAWVPNGSLANGLVGADTERARDLAEQEYRRLLYVGMTRAADRLVVCGYSGQTENRDIWHAMVREALAGDAERCRERTFTLPDGSQWEGLSWRVAGSRTFETEPKAEAAGKPDTGLPAALSRPLPPQRMLPRPLSPSGAGAMIDDGADDAVVTSPLFATKTEGGGFFLQRGRLVHRMLQMLPDFPPADRAAAARRYVSRIVPFWPESERERLIASVLGVLSDPSLAGLFSASSRAETSIMGTIRLHGRDFAVSGRVDRIGDDGECVTIADFKTNLTPPSDAAAVSFAHRAQLAIYAEVLKPLYPGRRIECLLIYTQSGKVIRLSGPVLDESLAALAAK